MFSRVQSSKLNGDLIISTGIVSHNSNTHNSPHNPIYSNVNKQNYHMNLNENNVSIDFMIILFLF